MKFYTNIKPWGDNLLYIGYDNHKRIQEKIPFKPSLWISSSPGQQTNSTDIFGNLLSEMNFDSIKEAKDFIKTYEGVDNFKVYGTNRFEQLFIAQQWGNKIDYDGSDIRKFVLDIETGVNSEGNFAEPEEADAPITLITIHDSKNNKFVTFANIEDTPTRFNNIFGDELDYREHSNEFSMLADFLGYWISNYPDVVTGWNSRGYDVTYLVNRMKIVLGEKQTNKLSPWGIIQAKTSNISRYGKKESTFYEIYGISELDYMDLYMKYSMENSESFSLDFISKKEIGEGKIPYDGTLSDLYKTDFQKYVEYNIHDVRLVLKIDKKKQFLNLIIDVSYFGKVSGYNDSLGTTRFWEHLIFNHLYSQQKLPEITPLDLGAPDEYKGGYVKEPKPGLSKWVVSIDATSLYPSLIRQINIGIDTHIPKDIITDARAVKYRGYSDKDYIDYNSIDNEFLKENKCGLACNGEIYSNDSQSFLSELMEMAFKNRKDYKNTMLDYKRQVAEIEKEINKRK